MIRALWLCLALLFPAAAAAQGTATLVADQIAVEPGGILIAEGNVEVLYGTIRMSASRVVYDQPRDQLRLDGPIIIADGDQTVIAADAASIDPGLMNGLLRGARLVLNRQLQLAANRLDRVDGRYSQLSQAAVTSCDICDDRPPLWSIRAARVVHDEEARQIYFENARFLVYDLPVFWLPRLRLPDPTRDRLSGFLAPRFRTNTQLGPGLKLPYFVTLGPHRDLTITPYFARSSTTLELRYRQAFRTGFIELNTSVSRDDLRPGETRGAIWGSGRFDLPREFELTFDIEGVSDDGYLLDYGISDRDRIDSAIDLRRVDRDLYFNVALFHIEFLRDGVNDATEPSILSRLHWERRFFPGIGQATLRTTGDTVFRFSEVDGPGRDVSRLGAELAWQHSWTTGGLIAEAEASLLADWYGIAEDSSFDSGVRSTAGAAITLRYPLIRQGRATHVLEPVVQLAWSETSGITPPNEDTLEPFLDEASLTGLFRLPGQDIVETGPRANIGLTWTRHDPAGWSTRLTLGRVLRNEEEPLFPKVSGLGDTASDWLLAASLTLNGGLSLSHRSIIDEGFSFTSSETRVRYVSDRLSLSAGHIWTIADGAVGRPDPISEWALDGRYRVSQAWSIEGDVRYDLVADRAAEAGLGLIYSNECVEIDLSVSRRYTDSTSVDPTTNYGLGVSLKGFSANSSAGSSHRSCSP